MIRKTHKMIIIFVSLTIFMVSSKYRLTPLNEFEVSIFSIMPIWGYIAISIGIIILYIVSLSSVFKREVDSVEFSLSIICLTTLNVLIILLPALRGYHWYAGVDPLTVKGHVIAVVETGTTTGLIYPAMHLWIAATNLISSTSVNSLIFAVPVLYSAFMPLSFFVWARRLFDNQRLIGFITVASTIQFFSYRRAHTNIDPQAATLILVPLILMLVAMAIDGNRRAKLLAACGILAIPVAHPVTGLVVISVMFAAWFVSEIFMTQTTTNSNFKPQTLFLFGTLGTIGFIQWLRTGPFFQTKIQTIAYSLMGTSRTSAVDRNVNSIANFDLIELATLFIKWLGHDFIWLVIGGIGFLMVLKKYYFHSEPDQILIPATWFIVASMMQLIHIVTGIFSLFIYRFVGVAVIGAIVLSALPLKAVLSKFDTRTVRSAVIILFVVTAGIGLASTHATPYIDRVSQDTPQWEFEATEWSAEHIPSDGKIKGIATRPFRLADGVLGTHKRTSPKWRTTDYLVMEHMGYIEGSPSTTIPPDTYVFLTSRDLITFQRTGGRASLYTPNDLQRFRNDTRVQKIFVAGPTEIHRVT